jgi:prepilin-type N-terminal cleavage/methylation domain-containing protein
MFRIDDVGGCRARTIPGRYRHYNQESSAGVTLIELLIVMGMVAILLSLGTPAMTAQVMVWQSYAQASRLLSAIMTARSQAVRASTAVLICPGNPNRGTLRWTLYRGLLGDQRRGQAAYSLRRAPGRQRLEQQRDARGRSISSVGFRRLGQPQHELVVLC